MRAKEFFSFSTNKNCNFEVEFQLNEENPLMCVRRHHWQHTPTKWSENEPNFSSAHSTQHAKEVPLKMKNRLCF